MKILLTGGTGQVGHELEQHLRSLGDVVSVGRKQLDLEDLSQTRRVVHGVKPDLIINAAAYTSVDNAETEPGLAMRINAEAPAVLAEEAYALGASLIHYSTDYVFDGAKRDPEGNFIPYTEDDRVNPINVYGRTKLAGEQAIIGSGCPYFIFRTSWVYSMYGNNFLRTMLRLAAERNEIDVIDEQWGAPTWARWIAMTSAQIISQSSGSRGEVSQRCDLSANCKKIIPSRLVEFIHANSGIYNLTSAGSTTWRGFADEIFLRALEVGLLKETPLVRGIRAADYPALAKRPANSMLSNQSLVDTFKVQPPFWKSSLAECIASN